MFLEAGQAQGLPQGASSLIMLVLMLAIFYFFAIRPQKKREKEVSAMRDALKPGDEVVTIGGIEGKISIAKEDYVVMEVKPNKVKMQFSKWAIATVKKEGKAKEVAEEKEVENDIDSSSKEEATEE